MLESDQGSNSFHTVKMVLYSGVDRGDHSQKEMFSIASNCVTRVSHERQ